MHVVITGASAGIGEALAREFHKRGATLSLLARRKEKLDALAKELAKRVFVYGADLADPKAASKSVAACVRDQGAVDVLVNNAGVQIIAPATTQHLELSHSMISGICSVSCHRRSMPNMQHDG